MASALQHSNLWRGYGDYEVHRGTLTGAVVTTLTFSDQATAVSVEHLGAVTNDIFVTFDDGATEPTSDGTGDTNKKMYRVLKDRSISFDKATTKVKLISAGAAQFQVTALR